MKARIIEIAFNHPRAQQIGERRVRVGDFKMDSGLFAAFNENVGRTLNLDEEREVRIMTIRFATLDDDPGVIVDIAGPEMFAKIHERVKKECGYREVTPDPNPEEYEQWARKHEVWL